MSSSFGPKRDALACALVALLLRAGVVLWGQGHVPPAADGAFYHVVAGRIAEGLGYTWLWPDGAVTYAAHYPIGYPGLLGGAYFLFGAQPGVAMWLNALVGAFGCWVVHSLCLRTVVSAGLGQGARAASNFGALLVALSPTLIGYTPALMTEAAVGVCLVCAVWTALRASETKGVVAFSGWLVATGLVVGCSTLLRPQSVLMAPALAALAWWLRARAHGQAPTPRSLLRSLGVATTPPLVALGVALLVVTPWTLRNCERMEKCVFVSANGGWNLLIGTYPEGQGAFVAIDGARVPAECREVYQEAAKDTCFGAAGQARIRKDPVAWLRLIPAKLSATFEYNAVATDYLSSAGALSDGTRRALSVLELAYARFGFVLVVIGVLRPRKGDPQSSRLWVTLGLGLLFLGPWAHWAWLLLFPATVWFGRRQPFAVWANLAALGLTCAIHAAFFGAGRYTLPLLFLGAPVSALGWACLSGTFDRSKPVG